MSASNAIARGNAIFFEVPIPTFHLRARFIKRGNHIHFSVRFLEKTQHSPAQISNANNSHFMAFAPIDCISYKSDESFDIISFTVISV